MEKHSIWKIVASGVNSDILRAIMLYTLTETTLSDQSCIVT